MMTLRHPYGGHIPALPSWYERYVGHDPAADTTIGPGEAIANLDRMINEAGIGETIPGRVLGDDAAWAILKDNAYRDRVRLAANALYGPGGKYRDGESGR